MLERLFSLHIYLVDLQTWIFPEFPADSMQDARMLAESIALAWGWDGRQGAISVFEL